MTAVPPRSPRAGLWAVALAAVALGACTHSRAPLQEPLGHGPMPPEYQQRHPILLSRATQALPIEVGTHTRGISGLQRADIESFVRSYRADGEGVLAISVPSGAANETAAVSTAREIRRILAELNVPAAAVTTRPYRPDTGVPAPPVTVSYTRLRAAVPHRCAVTTDLDDPRRAQWEAFGCATQTNLAAMIANPNDLQGPRPMDRPSAQRRYQVLDRHNQSQDPSTAWRNQNAGAVSTVGQR